jgi:MFS family permease
VDFLKYSKLKITEILGLSTFQFLAFFRRTIVYGFLAIYLRSLGLSNFEVTLMATFGMVANAATQSFVWGNLLDRIKRPNAFVIWGEILAGLAHFVMVLWYQSALMDGNKIWAGYIIIISLGVIEVFWSMSNVGWSTMVSQMTTNTERKRLMGQLFIIGGVGGIIGAQVGGQLFEGGVGFDNGIIFYIAAVTMIGAGIIVWVLIRERKVEKQITDLSLKLKFKDLPENIKKTYIWFIIALIIINFGRNSIAVLTGIFLTEPEGFNATGPQVALFSNISAIAMIFSGILVGSIVSKVNDNRVLYSGALSAIFGILWLVFAPTYELALIGAFFIGAAHVIIESAGYSIVAAIVPEEFRGRLFGIFNATFFLSWGIAATLITGPIADLMIYLGYTNVTAYRTSFLVGASIVIIGLLVLHYSFKLINQVIEEKQVEAVNISAKSMN